MTIRFKSGLPRVSVTLTGRGLGGQTLEFIVDTGAEESVVALDIPASREVTIDGKARKKSTDDIAMEFHRETPDGKLETVKCKAPVLIGKENIIGMDQLRNTESALFIDYGRKAGRFERSGGRKAPSKTLPTRWSNGRMWVFAEIKGCDGKPLKIQGALKSDGTPDDQAAKGEIAALIDTGADQSTIGKLTADLLAPCATAVVGGAKIRDGYGDTIEVVKLSGVEVSFDAGGERKTCKLPVAVHRSLVIGSDQLASLRLSLFIDPLKERSWLTYGAGVYNDVPGLSITSVDGIVRHAVLSEVTEVGNMRSGPLPRVQRPTDLAGRLGGVDLG